MEETDLIGATVTNNLKPAWTMTMFKKCAYPDKPGLDTLRAEETFLLKKELYISVFLCL